MSTSVMEEDLEDMPLASLADLRPSNDIFEVENSSHYMENTVVASAISYRNDDDEDDDSNLESLSVSEARSDASSDVDSEEILPEAMPDEIPIDIPSSQQADIKPNPPESWPTLEILPGGFIKPAIDIDEDETTPKQKDNAENTEEMMYACAKCPQRFKFLFCLVKHVRWHEDEKKREEGNDLSRLNILEKDLIALKVARLDVTNRYRKQKLKIMDRIAKAVGDLRAIKKLKDRKNNEKT